MMTHCSLSMSHALMSVWSQEDCSDWSLPCAGRESLSSRESHIELSLLLFPCSITFTAPLFRSRMTMSHLRGAPLLHLAYQYPCFSIYSSSRMDASADSYPSSIKVGIDGIPVDPLHRSQSCCVECRDIQHLHCFFKC